MTAGVPLEVVDADRLRAVDRFGTPDTQPVPANFGRLIDLAVELLRAPLGFFTVVDAESSWYAASNGVPPEVTCGSVEGSFCKYVIAEREPLFVEAAETDPRTAGNPAIASMGVRAWAGWPVMDPTGQVLGSFCVVDTVNRGWTADDRRILATLAAAATDEVALLLSARERERARKIADDALAELAEVRERQSRLLRLIQRSLLPSVIPDATGLEVVVRYQPANTTSGLGGDWYDVIDLGHDRTGLVIADVSGHDAEAVALMAQLRPSLHAYATGNSQPSNVLRQLHELIVELDQDRFLSIFYGIWDPTQRIITFQSAGHPEPLVVGADGSVTRCDEGRTGLLGIAAMPPADSQHELRLEPGDALVVFTDGLYEQRGRTLDDGQTEVIGILGASSSLGIDLIADRLMAEAEPETGWEDDVALMIVRAQL